MIWLLLVEVMGAALIWSARKRAAPWGVARLLLFPIWLLVAMPTLRALVATQSSIDWTFMVILTVVSTFTGRGLWSLERRADRVVAVGLVAAALLIRHFLTIGFQPRDVTLDAAALVFASAVIGAVTVLQTRRWVGVVVGLVLVESGLVVFGVSYLPESADAGLFAIFVGFALLVRPRRATGGVPSA